MSSCCLQRQQHWVESPQALWSVDGPLARVALGVWGHTRYYRHAQYCNHALIARTATLKSFFCCFCYVPLSFLHLPFFGEKKSIDLSERSARNVFINMHHPNRLIIILLKWTDNYTHVKYMSKFTSSLKCLYKYIFNWKWLTKSNVKRKSHL